MAVDQVQAGDWLRPCKDCGRSPSDGAEFHAGGRGFRKSYCVECVRIRVADHAKQRPDLAKARELRRKPRDWPANNLQRWQREDPEVRRRKLRNQNVRRVYGISVEEYEFRYNSQGGTCAICECEISLGRKGPGRPAHLDHDHGTGKLRDFLCDRCNVMVGMARESQDILGNAVLYLESHR